MIETIVEKKRGCGFRHSGPDGVGIYFIGEGRFEECERMPFPLSCCPICNQGIKFSRGFTWIIPSVLMALGEFPMCRIQLSGHLHATCPVCFPYPGKHGLLWVGEKFYTPDQFLREAHEMGISKRISSIPRGFEFGKHVIYMAHKKAIITEGNGEEGSEFAPGIFTTFMPKRIELVVDTDKEDELPEKAKRLAKQHGDNVKIVHVIPEAETDVQPQSPVEEE